MITPIEPTQQETLPTLDLTVLQQQLTEMAKKYQESLLSERRSLLQRVADIDRLLGKNPRRCQNCGEVIK